MAEALWAELPENQPANPSTVFSEWNIIPGEAYLVPGRVSSPKQRRQGHLEAQVDRLIREVLKKGGVPVEGKHRVGKGSDFAEWLAENFDAARKFGIKYVIMESVDRYVRSDTYSNRNQGETAAKAQLGQLQSLAGDLVLMVRTEPDSTPGSVRSYQTRRGNMAAKTKNSEDQALERCRPYALHLVGKGVSCREAARTITEIRGIPISHMTVYRWAKEAGLDTSCRKVLPRNRVKTG